MDKDFVLKVGKNIKKYRQEKGVSQFQLAIEIGCTTSAISGIEIGRSDTTLTKINAIAKALNIEPYKLLKFDK